MGNVACEMSQTTHEWVMSRFMKLNLPIWAIPQMSHVTCVWVTLHVNDHVTYEWGTLHKNESDHTLMSHVTHYNHLSISKRARQCIEQYDKVWKCQSYIYRYMCMYISPLECMKWVREILYSKSSLKLLFNLSTPTLPPESRCKHTVGRMHQANKQSAAAGGPTSTRARLTCPNCGRSRTAREFTKVCWSVSCGSASEGERQRAKTRRDGGREGWWKGERVGGWEGGALECVWVTGCCFLKSWDWIAWVCACAYVCVCLCVRVEELDVPHIYITI